MRNKTKWNLETLNKAYQRGFMTGLSGRSDPCPYNAESEDVLEAAWQSGFEDGRSIEPEKDNKVANLR